MKHFSSWNIRRCMVGAAAVSAVLVVSACGSSSGGGSGGEGNKSALKICYAVDTGGINDGQYYEVAYKALQKLEKQGDIELTYLTASGAQDYVPMINTFVSGKNCGAILALGSVFAPAVESAAKANTDQKFIMVDAAFTDKDGKVVTYPNVANITFKNNEASFLPGYIAAATTKTGKVGVWGGQPNPQVLDHLYGYSAGVEYYNKEKGADVKVIGFDPQTGKASMTGSFSDQQAGYAMTEQQIKQGADIIFSAGGQSDLGKVAAAKDNKGTLIVWVVNDTCEDPELKATACPLQLTSSLVNIDVPISQVVSEVADGKWESGLRSFGLKTGAVGPAPFHEVQVPDSLKTDLEAVTQKAKDGEIEIPSAPGA